MSPLGPAAVLSRESAREPLLLRPFDAAMTGWVVIFGAMLIEIIGGSFALRSSPAVTIPLLVTPVVVAYGLGITQWWQARQAGTEPASKWHLAAIPAAVLLWYLCPRTPQQMMFSHNARAVCLALPIPAHTDCVARAAQAFDYSSIAWWSALGLIAVAALFARRSRIAAWAALPAALAGCVLANTMLEHLLVHFNVAG